MAFIMIFFINCRDSSTSNDESLILKDNSIDYSSRENDEDIAENIGGEIEENIEGVVKELAEEEAEEIAEEIEVCVDIYEWKGIPTAQNETMFLNCLIETTHDDLIPVENERPYLLVNIDISRTHTEVSTDEIENLRETDIEILHEYDVMIPFSINHKHSILFEVGMDLYVSSFNSLSEFEQDGYSSLEGGLGKFSSGGIYKISLRDGYIGITALWDAIKNRDAMGIDEKEKDWHHQIRGGFEYVKDNDSLSINYHHALSDWIYDQGGKEQAQGGFDIVYNKTIDMISLYVKGEVILTEEHDDIQTSLGFGSIVNLNCGSISASVDFIKNGPGFRTTQFNVNSSWDSRCF